MLSQSGTAQVRAQNVFKREEHQPPRLDYRGYNHDPTPRQKAKAASLITVQPGEVKIPDWWKRGASTNPNLNATDMRANRKKALIPDASFDLDGDGVVGNRDLVIAKLFDKDGDGKLNAEERKNAEDAIKNVSGTFNG